MKSFTIFFFIIFSFLAKTQDEKPKLYYQNQKIDSLITQYQLLRKSNRISVYRIVLISSESPERIEKIKKNYLKIFPLEIVEEVFESPYFKAVTGAYLDKKDADKKRKSIRNQFKSSFVFEEKVSIETFKKYHKN